MSKPPVSPPDVPARAGGAALGARLRRLSDRIDRDSGAIYASRGHAFEQRWFGVMHQLHSQGSSNVAELAKCLGVSHVAVSQIRKAMEARGLVTSSSDPGDARRTLLTLSAKGRRLATSLEPTWEALAVVAAELNREAGDVVNALTRLEDALARRGLKDRVLSYLERNT